MIASAVIIPVLLTRHGVLNDKFLGSWCIRSGENVVVPVCPEKVKGKSFQVPAASL
jgi:hypothetical protein